MIRHLLLAALSCVVLILGWMTFEGMTEKDRLPETLEKRLRHVEKWAQVRESAVIVDQANGTDTETPRSEVQNPQVKKAKEGEPDGTPTQTKTPAVADSANDTEAVPAGMSTSIVKPTERPREASKKPTEAVRESFTGKEIISLLSILGEASSMLRGPAPSRSTEESSPASEDQKDPSSEDVKKKSVNGVVGSE